MASDHHVTGVPNMTLDDFRRSLGATAPPGFTLAVQDFLHLPPQNSKGRCANVEFPTPTNNRVCSLLTSPRLFQRLLSC
jgi:hypothetical protein